MRRHRPPDSGLTHNVENIFPDIHFGYVGQKGRFSGRFEPPYEKVQDIVIPFDGIRGFSFGYVVNLKNAFQLSQGYSCVIHPATPVNPVAWTHAITCLLFREVSVRQVFSGSTDKKQKAGGRI